MSHSVTIRTATVTTSGNSSSIFVNTSYIKSYAGFLKLLQLALGIVCVGIIGHHYNVNTYYNTAHHLFFFLMVTTFMIATFTLLLSCIISLSTASIISKTIFEVIYHSLAFGLLLAASLTLLIKKTNEGGRSYDYELMIGAASCGLINAILYFFSTVLALRSYRGM